MKNIEWKSSAGQITICPEYGRVLQVSLNGEPAFWNNPNFCGDWNIGGDRLWVAPEISFHWMSLIELDFTHYTIQKDMDPGNWSLEEHQGGYCRISQNVELKNFKFDSISKFNLARTFTQIENCDTSFFESAIAYQTENELKVISQPAGASIGMWSLLQIPGGGEICIACKKSPAFRDYFTPIPQNLWKMDDDLATFEITGKNQYKIGIQPGCLTGKQAYIRPLEKGYMVIFRQFFPQPWREYCDVPLSDMKSQGDALQIYCDNGDLGNFGELEFHSPSINSSMRHNSICDVIFTMVGVVKSENLSSWIDHWLK